MLDAVENPCGSSAIRPVNNQGTSPAVPYRWGLSTAEPTTGIHTENFVESLTWGTFHRSHSPYYLYPEMYLSLFRE